MSTDLDRITAAADARFDDDVDKIKVYVGYEAISDGGPDGPTAANVLELARRILNDLKSLPGAIRPSDCSMHELPGAFPVITAEWRAGDHLPTLLVYGHADVQPADPSEWKTPPFKAVLRDGRLYGRGTSDDIGGWLSHIAALRAWLAVEGKLPVNLRLLLEFEEEIGSPNLMAHIDALEDFCGDVDAMVLTDCENPNTDTPGLTVSLRGLLTADLVCSVDDGGHSGLYGSIRPDPSLALIQLTARLLDVDGRPNFPRMPLTEAERQLLSTASGVVSKLPDRGRPAAEWAWRQPAITILGTTLPDISRTATTNVIRQRVAARLSIRVPPGLTANAVLDEVKHVVTASPPPGITVALVPVAGESAKVDSWLYDIPDCVAFEAVDRAYESVWGKTPERIGRRRQHSVRQAVRRPLRGQAADPQRRAGPRVAPARAQ